MSKAIYLGAGTDILPLILYSSIKNWILVDSQPLSEFGIIREKGYERKSFIPELLCKMNKHNFLYQSSNFENKLIFYNSKTKQKVLYYINCAIPEEYNKIKEDISGWNVLVDIGFHPNNIIFDAAAIDTPLLLIGHANTCYYFDKEADDYNDVINTIHLKNFYFSKYELINKQKKIIQCNNICDFEKKRGEFNYDSDYFSPTYEA
ncbi:hypothetical protein CPAV1605_1074 [seawater metagenome]|uniref:Uncharacterized protein n=1 Tax=seawater metagenome TaxID=1561972 RepID=A0A5E8CIW4_9ZZZZ